MTGGFFCFVYTVDDNDLGSDAWGIWADMENTKNLTQKKLLNFFYIGCFWLLVTNLKAKKTHLWLQNISCHKLVNKVFFEGAPPVNG